MATSSSDEIDILEKAKRMLSSHYVPSEDEPYMNPQQQNYFRQKIKAGEVGSFV